MHLSFLKNRDHNGPNRYGFHRLSLPLTVPITDDNRNGYNWHSVPVDLSLFEASTCC